MKKFFMRIFIMVVSIIRLLCGLCYADAIAPDFPYSKPSYPIPSVDQPETVNVAHMVIMGIVIAVIVVISIIVLIKSSKNKEKEVNN